MTGACLTLADLGIALARRAYCRGSARLAICERAGQPGECMTKIMPVIMCGGSGTRMWPESRESLPKQFIPLIGAAFDLSIDRQPGQRPRSVRPGGRHHQFRVSLSRRRAIEGDRRRGGDPARAGPARQRRRCRRRGRLGGGARSEDGRRRARRRPCVRGRKAIRQALRASLRGGRRRAKSSPSASPPTIPRPATAIFTRARRSALDPQVRRIERFVEKPDEARARAFIEDGYLWNSGNFVFRADVMLEELQRFEPEIAAATAAAVSAAKKDLGFVVLDHESFAKAPKTSIDYAVMERTDKAVVLTADVGWSDVGEWSAVWRLSPRDANGNSLRGRAVAIDSSNVLVRSEEQLAAVIGLKDVIVVATGDAVLVADRSQTAKVKKLVERLKARGPSGSDRASAQLPAMGLLSEHRPGLALSGQTHRRASGRTAFAAKAPPSRGALGGRARRGRGDAQRQGRRSCTRTNRSTCRSARPTGSPTPARSTSS